MPKEAIPEFNMPKEEGHDEAWKAEIARSIKEIDKGKAKMLPMGEVMKELRELITDCGPAKYFWGTKV